MTQIMTSIQPQRHVRHNCINLLTQAIILVRDEQSNCKTQEEINGTKRENMPKVMNEGVKMSGRSFTAQVLTVVGLFVELSTDI